MTATPSEIVRKDRVPPYLFREIVLKKMVKLWGKWLGYDVVLVA